MHKCHTQRRSKETSISDKDQEGQLGFLWHLLTNGWSGEKTPSDLISQYAGRSKASLRSEIPQEMAHPLFLLLF